MVNLPKTRCAVTSLCAAILLCPATTSASQPLPDRLVIAPDHVVLRGEMSRQQVLVSGIAASQSFDLTSAVRYQTSDPAVATVDEQGVIRPVANGQATITARTTRVSASV